MSSVANHALFINGVFQSVLEKILLTQADNPDYPLFLQPASRSPIVFLKTSLPTTDDPVMLYVSTTDGLNMVSYVAEIVGWEDITDLSLARSEQVNDIRTLRQPDEGILVPGQDSINLLSIRRLTKLDEPFSVGELVKVRDGKPLSTNRTRAGLWSVVYQRAVVSEGA